MFAYKKSAPVGKETTHVLHMTQCGNTFDLSCVCALGILQSDDESRVEVQHDEMTFFTHQVNGQTYGAWYRQLAPRELEIIGAGFMCKTPYAGCDELSVARSVLEDSLRAQMERGAHPQSLDDDDSQRDSRGG